MTSCRAQRLEALRTRHDRELARLERKHDRAKEAYRRALADWSD